MPRPEVGRRAKLAHCQVGAQLDAAATDRDTFLRLRDLGLGRLDGRCPYRVVIKPVFRCDLIFEVGEQLARRAFAADFWTFSRWRTNRCRSSRSPFVMRSSSVHRLHLRMSLWLHPGRLFRGALLTPSPGQGDFIRPNVPSLGNHGVWRFLIRPIQVSMGWIEIAETRPGARDGTLGHIKSPLSGEVYPALIKASEKLRCRSAIIDGEAVVQDALGVSDFYALRAAMTREPDRVVFFAFDLLHLDGKDLRGLPLVERRAAERGPRRP